MTGGPAGPVEITEPNILVPEGKAERYLLERLLGHRDIEGFQVLPKHGGDSVFGDRLESIVEDTLEGIEIHSDTVEAIVIVTDNNSDPDQSVQEVQDHIRNVSGYGLPVPDEPWTIEAGDPSLAIVTLPSTGTQGTIETLIWEAFESEHPEQAEAVEEFVAEVPTGQSDSLTTREKAKISVMLGATCTGYPSVGVADMWQSNKGYQHLLDNEAFDPLVELLNEV